MRIVKIIIVMIFISKLSLMKAQEVEKMTLSELIEIGLSSNPIVKSAENRLLIAENEYNIQPFMPNLRGYARTDNSTSDSKRTFRDEDSEFVGAKSNSVGAGLNFSWRLFDGLGMFAEYKRSQKGVSIQEMETRRVVEDLVVNITTQYYLIVIQEHRVNASKISMDLSRERFRIVQEQVNIGSASKIDLQQARLDFHADSSSYLKQNQLLHNSYISLNRLTNQNLRKNNYINDTISLGSTLILEDLELMSKDNNSEISAAREGVYFSEANLNVARAARFPVLDFVSAYSINRSESPASITTFNQSKGISYGFEASMNFFDGFRVSKNIKNAKIEVENRQLALETVTLKVMSELFSLYNDYLVNLSMIEFEQQSMEVAKSNLDLALERYDLGLLSGIEFREFQLSYLNAVDRAMDAMFQSKVLELSLLISAGNMEDVLSRIE